MKGEYGVYMWFSETSNDEYIHPSDLEAFRNMSPPGKVFRDCGSADDGYIILQYGDRQFLVKSKLFRSVTNPKFQVGERVKITSKNETARVEDIVWHFRRGEPFYLLKQDGKVLKKRYYENDLEKVEE